MKQVERDAHRLKGTCGNMGASYIGRLFGQLETGAESADQESASLRLSEIEKEIPLVEIALMTECNVEHDGIIGMLSSDWQSRCPVYLLGQLLPLNQRFNR